MQNLRHKALNIYALNIGQLQSGYERLFDEQTKQYCADLDNTVRSTVKKGMHKGILFFEMES